MLSVLVDVAVMMIIYNYSKSGMHQAMMDLVSHDENKTLVVLKITSMWPSVCCVKIKILSWLQ